MCDSVWCKSRLARVVWAARLDAADASDRRVGGSGMGDGDGTVAIVVARSKRRVYSSNNATSGSKGGGAVVDVDVEAGCAGSDGMVRADEWGWRSGESGCV